MSESTATIAKQVPGIDGRPTVALKLGGETRHLLVTFGALLNIEQLTGKSIIGGSAWGADLKIRDVKLMTFAALSWCDKNLKVEDVGRWIHVQNMPFVLQKVTEAWTKGLSATDPIEDYRPLEIRPQAA
jgi:hypothetical protein